MRASDTIMLRPELLIYFLNLAVMVSAVCLVGLLASRICQRRSAPVQHAILASGLILTLLLPIAVWFGQRHGRGLLKLPVLSEVAVIGAAMGDAPPSGIRHHVRTAPTDPPKISSFPVSASSATSPSPDEAPLVTISAGGSASPDPPSKPPETVPAELSGDLVASRMAHRGAPVWRLIGTAAVYVWAVGLGIGLLRLVRTLHTLYRIRRSARRVIDSQLSGIVREAARVMRLTVPPRILSSQRVPVPMTLGVWAPVIFLPDDIVSEMQCDRLTAVLMHEMAHIARRDCLMGLAQQMARILFWWNPLIHRLKAGRISQQSVTDDPAQK